MSRIQGVVLLSSPYEIVAWCTMAVVVDLEHWSHIVYSCILTYSTYTTTVHVVDGGRLHSKCFWNMLACSVILLEHAGIFCHCGIVVILLFCRHAELSINYSIVYH